MTIIVMMMALCLLEHVFTIDLFEIFAFSVIGRYRRVIFFLSNYLVGIIVLEISLHTIHFSIVNIVIVWLEVRCF